jgi:hypothetical protein
MTVYILRNMKYMNTIIFGVWFSDGGLRTDRDSLYFKEHEIYEHFCLRSMVFGWQSSDRL